MVSSKSLMLISKLLPMPVLNSVGGLTGSQLLWRSAVSHVLSGDLQLHVKRKDALGRVLLVEELAYGFILQGKRRAVMCMPFSIACSATSTKYPPPPAPESFHPKVCSR